MPKMPTRKNDSKGKNTAYDVSIDKQGKVEAIPSGNLEWIIENKNVGDLITISGLEIKNGAGFIVVRTGKIFSMPGLPKSPAAEKIDLNDNYEIVGLY